MVITRNCLNVLHEDKLFISLHFGKLQGEPQMVHKASSIQSVLKEWLSDADKVVVTGIGNPLRTDDFVGLKIVQDLQGKVSDQVYLIESETVPENFIEQIIGYHPSHILLIDAALLGLEPGKMKIIEPNKLGLFPAFSTHGLPLRIFCEYLSKTTEAKIALLLVEPKEVDFGEGLTNEVQASVQAIVDVLLKALPSRTADKRGKSLEMVEKGEYRCPV